MHNTLGHLRRQCLEIDHYGEVLAGLESAESTCSFCNAVEYQKLHSVESDCSFIYLNIVCLAALPQGIVVHSALNE